MAGPLLCRTGCAIAWRRPAILWVLDVCADYGKRHRAGEFGRVRLPAGRYTLSPLRRCGCSALPRFSAAFPVRANHGGEALRSSSAGSWLCFTVSRSTEKYSHVHRCVGCCAGPARRGRPCLRSATSSALSICRGRRLPFGVAAVVIVQPVGGVGGLLYLQNQVALADGVYRARRDVDHIAGAGF